MVVGPSSTQYPLILVAPTVSSVVYNGTDVDVTWSALGGISEYAAVLDQGSSVTTVNVNTSSCSFTGPLSGSGYSVAVSGESSDHICVGPPSTAYDV